MKRRIIKQGHNTLTITLPSDWVKKLNLKGGDEIDLNEKDNGIFVSAEKNDENKRAEFSIDGMDIPTIWKYVMAVYREGYDEVLIRFSPEMRLGNPYKFITRDRLDLKYNKEGEKKTPLEFFHELVNRFLGFEIVEHTKDYVIIKALSESTPKEFDNSLRRVFLIIQQMAEETCEALEIDDTKTLNHIHDVDINLDKFHDYCIRILNRNCNKGMRKTSLLFSTLYLLELVGDEYKNIANHLVCDFKKTDFKNMRDIAASIKEQIGLYYEIFYKFEKDKINKFSEIDKGRYINVLKLYKRTKNEDEKEIFHHLRMIAHYINALLELRIEMEF